MPKTTVFFKADSLAVSGEVNMPLVVVKQQGVKDAKFCGFIPGVTKNDIVATSLKNCINELKAFAKNAVEIMAKQNIKFPFFPTKEEILQDFKNVEYISFVKIKSSKRKQ